MSPGIWNYGYGWRQLKGDRKNLLGSGNAFVFYRSVPDVQAVATHITPIATGSRGGCGLTAILPRCRFARKFPGGAYATPGTHRSGAVLEPYVPHYDALLLANHGAVTCGPDLQTRFSAGHYPNTSKRSRLRQGLRSQRNSAGSRSANHTRVAKLMAARARYPRQPASGRRRGAAGNRAG